MDKDAQIFVAGIIYGLGFVVACYWAVKVARFIWEHIEGWLFRRTMVYTPPPPSPPPFYRIHFGRCDLEATMQDGILVLEGRTSTFDDFELYLEQRELKSLHNALGELIEQAPFPAQSDDEAQR